VANSPFTKEQKRELKAEALLQMSGQPVDCACLIHSDGYSWHYVDVLYNMLTRNLSRPVNLHVYTEESRTVPAPYIKHSLIDWGIQGPKKSWWYKMQLFNKQYHRGPLLYFDLDTVIVKNIDWLPQLNQRHFWAIKDFKHLWRPTHQGINSSVMFWDTEQFDWIWQEFTQNTIEQNIRRYPGDQDYLSAIIPQQQRRYFAEDWVQSWRWQCLDGGYDFKRRVWHVPNAGTQFGNNTSILVFHGKPKPAEVTDIVVKQHWK